MISAQKEFSPTGFTFIEILVVVMIMSVFFGLGFANYRGFQRRQALESTARSVKSDLLVARQNATSGVKPAGCVVLDNYDFNLVNTTSYQIRANCTNATYGIKNVDISASGITLRLGDGLPATPNPIIFWALGNGSNISLVCSVSPCPEIILTQVDSGDVSYIEISSAGAIE